MVTAIYWSNGKHAEGEEKKDQWKEIRKNREKTHEKPEWIWEEEETFTEEERVHKENQEEKGMCIRHGKEKWEEIEINLWNNWWWSWIEWKKEGKKIDRFWEWERVQNWGEEEKEDIETHEEDQNERKENWWPEDGWVDC